MNAFRLLFLALALTSASVLSAQSLYMVKEYIKDGKYQLAAGQLKPLADGGNAEAQYLAAKLFFDGHLNTAKAEEQGVKYAKMAADQGYDDAIVLLVEHYYGTGEPASAFKVLKHYADSNPALRKGDIGMRLAYCYLEGRGTEKDEALAWQLMENNEKFSGLMKDKRMANQYWMFQAKQVGKSNLLDYADYLYAIRETTRFKELCSHITSMQYNAESYFRTEADKGNAFACAMLADILYEKGDIERARTYHSWSVLGGSAYGRSQQDKMKFIPVTYNINVRFDNRTRFVRVEHRYEKTILHGMFKGQHSDSWTQFYQEDYLLCNGKRYRMTSKSKRIYGQQGGAEVPFKLEFEPVPQDWDVLDLSYNGRSYMKVTRQDVR